MVLTMHVYGNLLIREVWRYQRGNQNPCIEEEQTTQWPKEKVQKDKQRSTKHHNYKKYNNYTVYHITIMKTNRSILVCSTQMMGKINNLRSRSINNTASNMRLVWFHYKKNVEKNSDDHQFHQYQQNERSPLILTETKHCSLNVE
jgi:hypothetical protein